MLESRAIRELCRNGKAAFPRKEKLIKSDTADTRRRPEQDGRSCDLPLPERRTMWRGTWVA